MQRNLPSSLSQSHPENQQIITNIRSILRKGDGTSLNYRKMNVQHCTRYQYSELVQKSTHIIRLSPVEDDIQEVVRATIQFSTPTACHFFEDSFGNRAIYATIEKPYSELTVLSEAVVKIYEQPNDLFEFPSQMKHIFSLAMPLQKQIMLPYLIPPEMPEPQLTELSNYALLFLERNNYCLLSTLSDINRTINREYTYLEGSTSVTTTVFHVFKNQQGVCQDFSNLLICLARILNVPARYRVGYLYTGKKQNGVRSDMSHAWVEVFFPYFGWKGFDPTNGCLVDQNYIRIACGRGYLDATPTSGTIFQGGGQESLSANVTVTVE